MHTRDVYIGLGGNIGDTAAILREALDRIVQISEVSHVRKSSFYQTKPVDVDTDQDFINAACALKTTLSAEALYQELAKIESALGKVPKAKNDSRILDLDILLFGEEWRRTSVLSIPHPRWQERLFVLQPLSDLTEQIRAPDEKGMIQTYNLREMVVHFKNLHSEAVVPLQ